MPVPLSLSGKVALITGGSRGIGAATVRLFTAADAKVVFSYQKARAQAESLVKECGEAVCYPVASNLDRPDAARALVAETVKRFGRLDILVANHGVWPPQDVPIERMSDEQWRSTLSINLDAVFGLVKHAVSQMKAQPRIGSAAGHIVLISSTSGQRGEAFHCDYSATKGADQHGERAVDGVGICRHLREFGSSRLGGHRDERRGVGRSKEWRDNPPHHSHGPRGKT
jgi:3-oxoacyl-[acyl-carrier protein] reductase